MARATRKITKKELMEIYGIIDVTPFSVTYCGRNGKISEKTPTPSPQFNKKSGRIRYLAFQVSLYNRVESTKNDYKYLNLPMAKLVYIWENGEIPEGYVVDHIDGNTLNCHPSNLRLVDEKFNLTENKRDWKYPPATPGNLEKFKTLPV